MAPHRFVRLFVLIGAIGVSGTLPAQETTPTPKAEPGAAPAPLVMPTSPTGWYSSKEAEHAMNAAKMFGRPLAILYQDSGSTCPLHNGQREAWMEAPQLSQFVKLVVETGTGYQDAPILRDLRNQAKGKEGKYIPMLFLGDASGKLLSVVKYEETEQNFNMSVGTALKTFGPMADPRKVKEWWAKLEQARTLWEKGEFGAAMNSYRLVKLAEKQSPTHAVVEAYKADEPKILAQAATDIAAAKQLLDQPEKQRARAELLKLQTRYATYPPADEVKALLTPPK